MYWYRLQIKLDYKKIPTATGGYGVFCYLEGSKGKTAKEGNTQRAVA
jgi:hypothetical protein